MSLQIMSLSGKVFFREILVKNGVCKKKLIENQLTIIHHCATEYNGCGCTQQVNRVSYYGCLDSTQNFTKTSEVMHVALSYCLLGLLITIALCANVLELLTKFYPRISNYRGNLVQVYNTCHKLLKQKPFLLNVLENF